MIVFSSWTFFVIDRWTFLVIDIGTFLSVTLMGDIGTFYKKKHFIGGHLKDKKIISKTKTKKLSFCEIVRNSFC